MENIKTVFMGSPDFAVPTLKILADNYPVVGVVTQPDRPAGRGRVMTPPPVKILADQLNIPVIQPEKLRQPEAMAQLEAWQPDLIVVAAFGQILRKNVLELPRFGCINVHASLLPRWRGAAPIQAAILHGDPQTGVTIMKMDPGIDTGPTLAQKIIPIRGDDTADILSERLAAAGGELLMETLVKYICGQIVPVPQDEANATYASMLKKEDGLLDFSQSADELERKIRAYYPWPGTFTFLNNEMLKVLRAHVDLTTNLHIGERSSVGLLPAIGTSCGSLILDEVQPSGKKAMPGDVFLRGNRQWAEKE